MLALVHSRRVRPLARGALLLGAIAVTATPAAAATHKVTHKVVHKKHHKVLPVGGTVYAETNAAPINEVVVFDRAPSGTLSVRQHVPTGGTGSVSPGCKGCPILDGQGEVELAANGRILFAVNAGSNTVSSFLETSLGLVLIDRQSSGGTFPVSLTSRGNLLYVLNQVSGNISGFTFARNGKLTPLSGSTESLSTPGPGGVAAQVGFDNTGRTLTVTQRGTATIDTFLVGANGVAGPATAHPSSAPIPFGFAYDSRGHLVVSDAVVKALLQAKLSTYATSGSGAITAIDTEPTQGAEACWVVITKDGRYVYVSNTASFTVSRFALGADGRVTLLGLTPTTAGGFPTDMALSADGRLLYVLVPSVMGQPTSHIDAFRIGAGGGLTLVASTPAGMLPTGVSGLAAR
ncbi:MAG: hypothetical protein QOF77_39 [Solirubrobacteraceae bacterium]|jgi:6-phosphogluconolactonase (cycloisomerase 2 family)|nr:hypothetical protein [Solirubrobacteraceae bacterium]